MLSADTTNRSLKLLLAGAVTTSELPWVCTYTLYTSNGVTPGTSHGTSNGVTPVTVMPAPGASEFRQLKYASVHNADTVSATVIIRYTDGATDRDILRVTLDPGDMMEYSTGRGWYVLDSTGAVKGAGGSPLTLPLGLADGGTGAVLVDPGADRMMFWDDSAGAVTWLTPGTNLSITGTTLNAAGATPAGADTQVQFNDSGVLGGDAGLTYNKTTDQLVIASATKTATLCGSLRAGLFSDGTNSVGLADGSYAVQASAGHISCGGGASNTFRWANSAAAAGTTAGGTLTAYYGSGGTSFLSTPAAWALVMQGSTVYRIPLYT
jgi:hypothetical protein